MMGSNTNNKQQHEGSRQAPDESAIRQRAKHNVLWLLAFNCYSSVVVFALHLITLESFLSVAISVSLTLYLYFETTEEKVDGSSLNWVLLSFAVITPLANSISMAFSRREQALVSISSIRSTLVEIYIAHSIWDWGKTVDSGKKSTSMNPKAHSEQVLTTIGAIQRDLTRFLTMPNGSRARHRTTFFGKVEAEDIEVVSRSMFDDLVCHMRQLSLLCEELKLVGLPGNEASRIRQWEHGVLTECEKLRMIKRYRTPQGLRSFGRLFSVFLPPFYSPYYANLARELDSLGMGIAFSVFTSIALTSLFETVSSLEDPFEKQSFLDGIDVEGELLDSLTHILQRQHRDLFSDTTEGP